MQYDRFRKSQVGAYLYSHRSHLRTPVGKDLATEIHGAVAIGFDRQGADDGNKGVLYLDHQGHFQARVMIVAHSDANAQGGVSVGILGFVVESHRRAQCPVGVYLEVVVAVRTIPIHEGERVAPRTVQVVGIRNHELPDLRTRRQVFHEFRASPTPKPSVEGSERTAHLSDRSLQ